MTDAWGGDPGHSGAKPMMHLQGSMGPVYTQTPMDSEAMTGGRVSGTAEAPVAQSWESTVIGSGMSGGDTPNRGTDSNGHRSAPHPA
jgi:hypothetical protein